MDLYKQAGDNDGLSVMGSNPGLAPAKKLLPSNRYLVAQIKEVLGQRFRKSRQRMAVRCLGMNLMDKSLDY